MKFKHEELNRLSPNLKMAANAFIAQYSQEHPEVSRDEIEMRFGETLSGIASDAIFRRIEKEAGKSPAELLEDLYH